MQCQTANMMQIEVNITFTSWLQVACGKKSLSNWKYIVLFQKSQGCGFGHPHVDVGWWALLLCENSSSGMVLLVSFRILPNFLICREWAGFYKKKMPRTLCELQSGGKALDDLYSPHDWSTVIVLPCIQKLCACNLVHHRIAESLRLECTSGELLIQHPSQSRVSESSLIRNVCVQSGFEYLQGWRLSSLSGQPVTMFDHAHQRKAFFLFNQISLYFSFWSLPFILLLISTESILTPLSLSFFPHQVFIHID